MPSRENTAHGVHPCGCGNLLQQRAYACWRYIGSQRRLLGQELTDGAIMAIGRMCGRDAEARLLFAVTVVVVALRKGCDSQPVADCYGDRQFTALQRHYRQRDGVVAILHYMQPVVKLAQIRLL
jgi:hypothetical protein